MTQAFGQMLTMAFRGGAMFPGESRRFVGARPVASLRRELGDRVPAAHGAGGDDTGVDPAQPEFATR